MPSRTVGCKSTECYMVQRLQLHLLEHVRNLLSTLLEKLGSRFGKHCAMHWQGFSTFQTILSQKGGAAARQPRCDRV